MNILTLPDDGTRIFGQFNDDDAAAGAAEDIESPIESPIEMQDEEDANSPTVSPPPTVSTRDIHRASSSPLKKTKRKRRPRQLSSSIDSNDDDEVDMTLAIKRSKLDWMVTEAAKKATKAVLNHLRPNEEDGPSTSTAFYHQKKRSSAVVPRTTDMSDGSNSPTLSENGAIYCAMVKDSKKKNDKTNFSHYYCRMQKIFWIFPWKIFTLI